MSELSKALRYAAIELSHDSYIGKPAREVIVVALGVVATKLDVDAMHEERDDGRRTE